MRLRYEEPRRLYAGGFEGRYHFFPFCKEINKPSNHEWKSCSACRTKTEEILDQAKPESLTVKDSNLEFERKGVEFHLPKCTIALNLPEEEKDTESMCKSCVKEEKIVAEARKRNKEYYLKA